MKRKQFSPIELHTWEAEVYDLPRHSHTYFELIYIFSGNGYHHLNQNTFTYNSGDLFLISPGDEHYFTVERRTKFSFIKFIDSYFYPEEYPAKDTILTPSALDIITDPRLKELKLTFAEPAKTVLRRTVENINDCQQENDFSSSPIIFHLVLTLIGLLRQAAGKLLDPGTTKNIGKEDLPGYIHRNIYDPKKLRVAEISSYFNISTSYFGAYFKHIFGQSYRNYINTYKTSLLERRILSSEMTTKQIAFEFGFTDESHLANYFRAQKHMSPKEFRSYKGNKKT